MAGLGIAAIASHRPAEPAAPPVAVPPVIASVAPPPVPSDSLSVADPTQADASELSPRARVRAIAWNPAAQLLSIDVRPVVDKKVDLTAAGAHIVYTYTANQGAGASRTREPTGRLLVTVTSAGGTTSTAPPLPGDGAARIDEPTCVAWAAMKAARGSGVPASVNLEARYAFDATLGRAVWTTRAPGRSDASRIIDGQTCAILAQRAPAPAKAGKSR